MTDKDREAFDRWIKGESTFTPNVHGDDTPTYIMWTAWQACAAHYAPKLTEEEAVELACVAFNDTFPSPEADWKDLPEGIKKDAYRKKMTAALHATGLRLKEEA